MWILFSLLFAACCAAVSLLAVRNYRNKMRSMLDSLLQDLDRAIGGELLETACDESLNAAIAERLNRIVRLWNQQRDRAEEERDAVKSLISDISHQVRTPLSNILLYTQLLKEQQQAEKSILLADKIQLHCEKLEFFMKELVRSSYAEKALIAVSPQPLHTEELIGTACQMIELDALKKQIRVEQKGGSAPCWADRKWTVEAIGTVLENAVKYSPCGSVIEIETCLYDSFACIRIKDRGMGIREEEQGRVFERFYRSRDAGEQPGFGIGLYLAREVLSKEGGYIKLSSKPGQGTEMSLYLPRWDWQEKIGNFG